MNRSFTTALALVAAASFVTGCTGDAVTAAPAVASASPSAAPAHAPGMLASTFASPLYGYTVAVPGGWTATAATMYADDPVSTGDTATDTFREPGTDTTIGALAWDLGGGTYAAWAKAYHDDVVAHVPQGCDGGDPSAWALIPVGATHGHLLQKCNNAEVMVPIGKRVYVFSWGNDTFDEGSHLPQSGFEAFLLGVTLPDAKAADRPLWGASPAP